MHFQRKTAVTSMHYQYIVYKWDIAQSHINTLRKVPSIYYKLVCKIVCNFQHYFGGRSKRESSCLEIRSSARFLREIWISYFARRILEGVFVGGIVNIRNECLFFSVHGKWIAVRNKQIAWTAIFFSRFMGNESQCRTNKSHENRFAVHAICLFRTAIHFPWTEKKRYSFL